MTKYLKIALFLWALVFSNIAKAETYYVNTEVLNLRSCENTNCKILGKLTSDEPVDVLEDKGEWVKVQTNKGEGYVIKRSLKKQISSDTSDNPILMLFFVIIILWIVFFFYMLPARLARNNRNADKIYKVNLFLGWIPGIWPILFVAALIGEKKNE